MVANLFHRRIDKTFKLDFGNRSKSVHRHADGDTGDGRFRQGRIDHPRLAKDIYQPLRNSKNPTVLSHIFPENEHS